ncbi:MAG: hypothetical protein A7315_02185 [Candidatus Altiarchaeales archaeon WOR_SM1_79]|nr:MAG: hypothetical protein A7315_02185 [Candidatus Altiarchaeales archaeon WOR_SM1_79]
MNKIQGLTDFFQSFNQKEAFYEKIMDKKNMQKKILNHLFILSLFSFIYGVFMGCFNGFLQGFSSGIKVPVLFTLIILICFPAFFVIQSILGSKLTLLQMLSIILSGFVMTTTILVSFAPIVLFFLITGGSYAFIQLLHVAIFTLAGLFGMHSIIEALKFSCEKKNIYPKVGVQVFKFWIVILAFVGAQLAWSLRPFIGAKQLPFQVFREQEGNIYQSIIYAVGDLLMKDKTELENQIEQTKEKNDKCISDSTLQEEDQEINTNIGEKENETK